MSETTVADILLIADQIFPFSYAEPWDNCGLQLGDPAQTVRVTGFGLDPNPSTIAWASENQCELLITHHPLLISPIRQIRVDDMVGGSIAAAFRAGISIISLHTNFDAAPNGLNDYLAERLELKYIATPDGAPCARRGSLPQPMDIEELAVRVRDRLELESVRWTGTPGDRLSTVFLASGSGMGYLEQARQARVDVIVTGDVKYHPAREAAELGPAVIDAGHFGTERFAPKLLAERFDREFRALGWAVKCQTCDIEREPMNRTEPGRRKSD